MQTIKKTFTGSQIIIQTLKNLEIDTIFGYPGGIVLGFYDELSKQNDIKHYLVRHEQAAIHAAEGYACVSGKCGCVLVTSGPGATNLVTGLANAFADGVPLLVITGQVRSDLIGTQAFGEVNIIDITKSCTKKNFQVKDIKNLKKTIQEAYYIANSGKKGPVLIDIPKDIFLSKSETDEEFIKPIENKQKINIQALVDALNFSEKPVIICGGGVVKSNSFEELKLFANKHNIPVVNTLLGIGGFSQSDKNYIGMIGLFGDDCANNALKNSDLILAFGSRLNNRALCCFQKSELDKKIVNINIDENSKNNFCADIKLVLKELLENTSIKVFKDNFTFVQKKFEKKSNQLHSFEALEEINNYYKFQEPIVVTDVGQHQIWAARCFKFNSPSKFITSGGIGTMGFGLPAAIGAAICKNTCPVLCVTGDGSFQMNLQELATCVEYNLPVKIIILNNGYLGMVRQLQEKDYEGRYSQTKITSPDFVKLAQAYNIPAVRITKKEDIKPALETYKGAVLLDIIVEPMEVL